MTAQTEPTNLAQTSILPKPTTLGGTNSINEILGGSLGKVLSHQTVTSMEGSFPVITGNVKTEAQAAGIAPFANSKPTLTNTQMYTELLVGLLVPSTPAIKVALANNIQDAFGSLKADVLGLLSSLGIESKEIKGDIKPSALAQTKDIATGKDSFLRGGFSPN